MYQTNNVCHLIVLFLPKNDMRVDKLSAFKQSYFDRNYFGRFSEQRPTFMNAYVSVAVL